MFAEINGKIFSLFLGRFMGCFSDICAFKNLRIIG